MNREMVCVLPRRDFVEKKKKKKKKKTSRNSSTKLNINKRIRAAGKDRVKQQLK